MRIKTRILIQELSIVLLAILLGIQHFANKNEATIGLFEPVEILKKQAGILSSQSLSKEEQHQKMVSFVDALEKELQSLPSQMILLNSNTVIKSGKLKDHTNAISKRVFNESE